MVRCITVARSGQINSKEHAVKFIRFTSAILLLLAFAFGNSYAQDRRDVVVMKNGDRITCEIKRLEAGVLYVSLDYVDGTIAVQWSKVARLESKRSFIVRTENGSVYTGTVTAAAAAGDQIVMLEIAETAEKKVEIETVKVVSIDTTSKGFWRRLNGDINAGLIYSKGNQSTQYDLSGSVEYPSDRWSVQGQFHSTLSSSSGSSSSVRNQVNLNFKRLLPGKNYFYTGIANFLQSSEQGIALQTSFGGGIGHYFKNTNSMRIALVGGLAWQRTNYDGTTSTLATQDTTAAVIATEIRAFRFKRTSFKVNASLLPSVSDPGRLYFKVNQSLNLKLYRNLSWNISFYGNWDNRPPGGLSGSDFGTSTGLGWSFGNK